VISITLRPLYRQGKSPWYPLDRRLGGIQSRSGRCGEEKNSQPPPGIEPYNSDRPARSPALYRLSYYGYYLVLIKINLNVFKPLLAVIINSNQSDDSAMSHVTWIRVFASIFHFIALVA
jgi:hypothetical protein